MYTGEIDPPTEATTEPTPVTNDGIEGGDGKRISNKANKLSFTTPFLDLSERKAPDTRLNCNADLTNRFYGNRGALQCLTDAGEVAVLELQYLKGRTRFFNTRKCAQSKSKLFHMCRSRARRHNRSESD